MFHQSSKQISLTIFVVLFALIMAGNAMAQLDPTSVTDGHVYLFENVGGDVPDDSANNHTANLIGSPQIVDGLKGKALQFNGRSDGVHIPDAATINLSTHQNHIVVAIFQCDDVDKSEKQVVYEEGGTTRGLTIYVHEGLVYTGGWNLSDYTPEWTGTFLSAPISSNQWVTIAAVLRAGGPVQEDDKFEMWMDGVLIDKGPGGQLQRRSDDTGIGYLNSQVKFHDGNVSNTGSYFEGAVDEVWILNQALTQAELSQWVGKPSPYAYGPYPANGVMQRDTWVTLSWIAGDSAVSHDVYFGDNFGDVHAGTGGTFRDNQTSNQFSVGLPGDPYPDGLVPGTTYYWRIDGVEADGVTKHKGRVWSFFTSSGHANNPVPTDSAKFVATDVTLTWTAGFGAESHTVYFGDDPDIVAYSVGGIPQTHNQYYPGALEFDRTYYWRVDEFDGAVTHKGDVWSFTTMSADASEPSVVSTFHCIGIYWSPEDGSSDNVCQVHYRSYGSTGWKEALPLWYDDRVVGGYPEGYRGSIVNLEPGTTYEIELILLNTGNIETFIASTWSEDFPIARTVYLEAGATNQALEITESGSPEGYILYTASTDGTVIDVDHNQDYCITVNASYIIIRGLNLKGAKEYGIRLYDCHDVVIEECDISDFSRIEDDGWGNRGAAIFSLSTKLKRIIVQRNKIHHSYSDTNSWNEYRDKYGTYHPRGPKPIGFVKSAGNHVIRYNEIYSDDDHYFEDIISAGSNNFPNRDSDIYCNYVANCWDDGIEAEGDNCNVRIWGNFIEWTFVKIAIAPTTVGPVYIWRNVAGVGRQDDIQSPNEVSRGGFLKTSDINGGGKIYVFHNTILQPEPPVGVDYPLGCSRGLGWGGPMLNTMSRNNILHVRKSSGTSIHDRNYDPLGSYNYDLYNGNINAYTGAERSGIRGVPIYDRNNGDGEFALDPSSPGYDAGVVIPNFNDNYNGAAPDIGAHEAGSPPMEFGVDAYQ